MNAERWAWLPVSAVPRKAKPTVAFALAECDDELSIPEPNYFVHASLGSLELRQGENTEDIGQRISVPPDRGGQRA